MARKRKSGGGDGSGQPPEAAQLLYKAALVQTLLHSGCVPEAEARAGFKRFAAAQDAGAPAAPCPGSPARPPAQRPGSLQTPATGKPSLPPSSRCRRSTWTSSACASRCAAAGLAWAANVWAGRLTRRQRRQTSRNTWQSSTWCDLLRPARPPRARQSLLQRQAQTEDEAAKKHGSRYTPSQTAYLRALLESIAAEPADEMGMAYVAEQDALYVTIQQATHAEVRGGAGQPWVRRQG